MKFFHWLTIVQQLQHRVSGLLLFIDNYDSFTYNLVQYFEQLGQAVEVWRNDACSSEDIIRLNPDYLVIGPGPCTPGDAGNTLSFIKDCAGIIPILGVCLGHQAIGQAFGANIMRCPTIMHGRVSQVFHHHQGIFAGLPSPFNATRYHSLAIATDSLPDCLEVTAWCDDIHPHNSLPSPTVMGIRHQTLPIEGVQFHPESILSEHGYAILKNFLANYEDYENYQNANH